MNNTLAITLLLMLNSSAICKAVITDPVADFKATYDMSGVSKIYKLTVDLNNDGKPDILMSPVQPDLDEQYSGWFVYIMQSDGTYQLASENTADGSASNDLLTFNIKKYKAGTIPELGKYGLLTLVCGRGGHSQCQLHAILFEGNKWKNVTVGALVDSETSFDKLAQRFPTPLTPIIEEILP